MTQWGVDALFNPAKRHMDEEKRRLQSTREEIGDSSGGKRIDFESGKVTIKRADADDEAGDDNGTGPHAKNRKERHRAAGAKSSEPSPAAVRAAARRGRQPR